jgi:hypothetical protein
MHKQNVHPMPQRAHAMFAKSVSEKSRIDTAIDRLDRAHREQLQI